MKPHHFQTLVLGALCVGAAVLAAETYNHHQQLGELLTAARNTPVDPVPAIRHDLTALGDHLDALQPQVLALREAQSQHTSLQIALGKQQDELAASLKAIEVLPRGPSSTDLATLAQRLTTAETELKQLSTRPTQPVAAKTPPSTSADQMAKPKVLAPPFTLLGLETRGTVRFVAVQPPGTHSLSTVHLLQLGDSLNGWQLHAFHGDQVVFEVPGHGSRSLPLP